MFAPVTSKYDNIYWQRLLVVVILSLAATGLILKGLFDHGDNGPLEDFVFALLLGAAALGFYLFFFLNSPPRKIVISDEHIIIENYLPHKIITIQYGEIEHVKTFIQTYERGGRFYTNINTLQIIQLELIDDKVYRIYENDFKNFEDIKVALREQLGKHQDFIKI